MSAPHDDSPVPAPESGDRDAKRYGATPPADPAAARYSDTPADPNATVHLLAPPSGGRLPPGFGGYELLEELGHGGMGVVYKARQLSPERLVALKVIRSGELATEDDVRRFRQEADEAARLDHPNIVPVYEVGEQDGLHFFTMKLVEGGGLDKHLERYRNDPKAAARLVVSAARAVHHAHQRQLLHRDLKPGNILLDAAGQPHVADFGLAKRMEGDAAALSRSNAIVGTPEYMAPEQAGAEKRLTTAVDVYALGGVLYALLTGRPPFQAQTPLDVLMKVVSEEPAPPSKVRLGAPRDLERICLKCLAKEPARRYGSAEALAEDLDRWLRGEPVRARPVGAVERLTKWARRRPALAAAYGLLLAALVLGAGGGGATWLWLGAEKARGEAETAKGNAETARKRAETAEGDAQLQRDEANRQRTRADFLAYAAHVREIQRLWEDGKIELARLLLDKHRHEEAFHGFEWGYLDKLCHPELLTLEQAGSVIAVAYTADGSRAAAANAEGLVKIWDANSGHELASCKGIGGPVISVAFSPNGLHLAGVALPSAANFAGGQLLIWDVETGRQLHQFKAEAGFVCVTYSHDGATFAVAELNHFVVRDSESGESLVSLALPSRPPVGNRPSCGKLAFSPDDRRVIAACADTTLRVWDVESGKELVALPPGSGKPGFGSTAAFSPDGSRVAALTFSPGEGDGVKVWDSRNGQLITTLDIHSVKDYRGKNVFTLAYSPDGRRVATSHGDNTIRLWDVDSGRELAVYRGHSGIAQDGLGKIADLAFTADGSRLASGSMVDQTVKVWDMENVGAATPPVQAPTFSGALAFSPDGRRVGSSAADNTVKVWEADTGRLLLPKLGADCIGLCFSPDGHRLAGLRQFGGIQVWDTESGRQTLAVRAESGSFVGDLCFSPDGRRLAGPDGMTAKVWDAETGRELHSLKGHSNKVVCVAYHPDGRRLATASTDGTVRVWDLDQERELLVLKHHTSKAIFAGSDSSYPDGVNAVAFSPDGLRLVSGGNDQLIEVWDLATGRELLRLGGDDAEVLHVAFTGDGRRLVSSTFGGSLYVWDATYGEELVKLNLGGTAAYGLAISSDGQKLVGSAGNGPWAPSKNGIIRLWDVAAPTPVTLTGRRSLLHTQEVDACERRHQWFAAAFHLGRLIEATPSDAALYARRGNAEIRLGRWQPAAEDFLRALMRWPTDDAAIVVPTNR